MFVSQTMLISVIGYEAAKREMDLRSKALWSGIEGRVAAFAEQYDNKRVKQVDCTGDILCERQGIRHKADCQGRTEPFTVYVRGIGSIQ